MDRDSANQISELIRRHSDKLTGFRLEEKLDTPLSGFHKWADERECVGAYRIGNTSGSPTALYVLLIEWSPQKNPEKFYLIVYRSARSKGPVYEINEVRNGRLRWKHVPRKRDGEVKNRERKRRFDLLASRVGLLKESHVEMALPRNVANLGDFLQSVFDLARIRDQAHDLDSENRIDTYPDAEAVFKATNAGGGYTAKRQMTGFQLQYNDRPAGGWGEKRGHWYILNPFASSVHDRHEAILSQYGFEQQERHRWWRLRGEAEATSFCRALAELTGEQIHIPLPGEEQIEGYAEGLVETVVVNRYERDTRNRRAAIEKHGTRCFGCDLEMQEKYGKVAEGYIHIHHTEPLSQVGGPRTPNLDELIPLCPNCHAVVHLQTPPLTVDQLRKRIGLVARKAPRPIEPNR